MTVPDRSSVRRRLAVALAVSLSAAAGCAGYQLGAETLFRTDVQSVHVPIFRSNSLRRHLGERLTEAVARKIDTVSAYRLADAATADSTLEGRIVYHRKSVLAEDQFDAPRDIEAKMLVELRWTDRNGLPLMQLSSVAVPDVLVSQAENFVPEGGQSLTTAQQRAIELLADQIIGQMEVRW